MVVEPRFLCDSMPGGLARWLRAAGCSAFFHVHIQDGELTPVPLSEVEQQVPRKVKDVRRRFFRCHGCGKVYWYGTHWENILESLQEAVRVADELEGLHETQ